MHKVHNSVASEISFTETHVSFASELDFSTKLLFASTNQSINEVYFKSDK